MSAEQGSKRTTGTKTFYTIWAGQLISQIGSGLTTFALSVHVFKNTGSVTQFAFLLFASLLPKMIFGPFIGALVDRWNRRRTMILGDSGAGLCTLVIALLFWNDNLEIWHLYILLGISSLSATFQSLAYQSSIALMVPKEKLGQANGFVQLGQALQPLISPILAAVLFGIIGVHGVVLIDFATFLFALTMLLIVRIPQPKKDPNAPVQSLKKDVGFAFNYLRERKGLVGLVGFGAVSNFSLGITNALLLPLLLTLSTVKTAGTIETIAGVGMLCGAIFMGAWGGPKTKVNGVLVCGALLGVTLMIIGAQPSVYYVGTGIFLALFLLPLVNGCSVTIMQSKVAPEVQGRVFSFMSMAVESSMLIAYPIAGPLADGLFEPMMMPGGALADSVGAIIGTGDGRGMGLMLIILGFVPILTAVWGGLNPRVRNVEVELPDAVTEEDNEITQEEGGNAPHSASADQKGKDEKEVNHDN